MRTARWKTGAGARATGPRAAGIVATYPAGTVGMADRNLKFEMALCSKI